MKITITTRHFNADSQTKDYLVEKLEKLKRFFSRIVSARAILIKEGYRHIAEVTLLARNMELMAKEASEDMHSAVDLAIHKLQKQLLCFRDKTKEHVARRYAEKARRTRFSRTREEI